MNSGYAQPGVPDRWSVDNKLLSAILRGIAKYGTVNKDSLKSGAWELIKR